VSLRILVFCEGNSDQRIACALADRVIIESVPWADGVLDSLRCWYGLEPGHGYTPLKRIPTLARIAEVKAHGFGTGDDKIVRMACLLALKERPSPDVVLWIRDTDGDRTRCRAIKQATIYHGLRVVAGFPHTKLECWVLVGFIPRNDEERERLRDLRQQLGFHPCEAAEQLTATQGQKKDGAKRDAKEVLWAVVSGDPGRETACWQETSLEELRKRGLAVGLSDYLDQVANHLAPLLSDVRLSP